MILPHRLRGSSHLFSFLSLLASPRNTSTVPNCLARKTHLRSRCHPSAIVPRRYHASRSKAERTGQSHPPEPSEAVKDSKSSDGFPPGLHVRRPFKKLVLDPEDRIFIRGKLNTSVPKSLRTETDVLNALRRRGYVPAVDRVEEMIDMNRSPYQKSDEFDKITLGLLLKTSKTVDGGIRNPYRVPGNPAGQNPVKVKTGLTVKMSAVHKLFLFPDDTNAGFLRKIFPLPEPPRPWHPIVMTGMKQTYNKEEVARRLEWSMVQNAKKLRNGIRWVAPDPEDYPVLKELPPPPPPVIRACNVCKKPRYLLRFWNFYYQMWQHVSSPHRPGDCDGHKRGSSGRLMFAPKGMMINGVKASLVENKEWIEEETAVKLLFRSGFIELPTVNQQLGKAFVVASRGTPEFWSWSTNGDKQVWALRGGRTNGLVDLSKVKNMSDIDAAQERQQKQFMIDNKEILEKTSALLAKNPITRSDAEKIPPGHFYPKHHPAVKLWMDHYIKASEKEHDERRLVGGKEGKARQKLKEKLVEYDQLLEDIKLTRAQILMMERGEGETWSQPEFLALPKAQKIQYLEKTGELEGNIEKDVYDIQSIDRGPYNRYNQSIHNDRYLVERGLVDPNSDDLPPSQLYPKVDWDRFSEEFKRAKRVEQQPPKFRKFEDVEDLLQRHNDFLVAFGREPETWSSPGTSQEVPKTPIDESTETAALEEEADISETPKNE
ncbi:hypothetical protein H072_11425 [Dactylellina haptotyla CBS 200.50]|uniref:Uncharacterized protein n=1 Tax=Dactylellina haptotyla (strain CBS 200.50) TaxID=1284197 RepID=S8B8C4_DACHA|nr:hypothetical protein H072_11425 [Dactylellina haptotyla CBS 200.50]